MVLSDIGAALSTIAQTSRYRPVKREGSYIVWAEDGQAAALHADGRMQEQTITGTVDYYTKTPDDPKVWAIQDALNGLGLAWRLESVQYEDETGYIHHEWVFEFAMGVE